MPDPHPPSGRRRRTGTRLGSVAGVPVLLAPSWPVSVAVVVVLVAVFAGRVLPSQSPVTLVLAAVALTALLMVGVLLHELGHLLAARMAGQRVVRIRFDVLGGQTDLIGPAGTPGRDAAVAAAGPVASIGFAAVGWGVARLLDNGSTPWLLAMTVCIINVLLAVFNLLPALPLDGGELVRSVVWRLTGKRRRGTLAGFLGATVVSIALLTLAAVAWTTGAVVGRPQAVVLFAMGVHLAGAAWLEARGRERATGQPSGAPHARDAAGPQGGAEGWARFARPIAVLAPTAAAGAVVEAGTDAVLAEPDGTVVGVVEHATAAARPPGTAAAALAVAQPAGAVLLLDDDDDTVRETLQRVPARFYLVADASGEPCALVGTRDLAVFLARPPAGNIPPPDPARAEHDERGAP